MVKTVLTISDSVEGTTFDLKRSTATIKGYELDPLLVVPKIIYKDNSFEENDVSEMIDYALGECDFSVLGVGFLTEPEVITSIADRLDANKKAPVVCCPSLISDSGEILVSGEVYEALCDRLLKHADYLIINTLEAEAFCGFECPVKNDYLRAAKRIFSLYDCKVFIRGNDSTDGRDVYFDGEKVAFIDWVPFVTGYEETYSLSTCMACEVALDKPAKLVPAFAIDFLTGKTDVAKKAAEEASKTVVPEVPQMSVPVVPKYEVPKAETPKFEVPKYVAPKAEEPVTKPAEETAAPAATPVSVTSSLVTPGKSLRDLARNLDALKTPADKPAETAVTSSIKTKGDVVSIAPPQFKFEKEVNNSITELQSLKDRLNNLNNIANSGK